METVGDATLCSEVNHLVHHVATASKAEADVTCTVEHHIGSLNKVLRTLLHGDTSEESHHLLLAGVVRTRNVLQFLLQWIDCVVHGEALTWVLVIVVDDRLTCQLGYTHDAVCVVHTVFLNAVDRRINLST